MYICNKNHNLFFLNTFLESFLFILFVDYSYITIELVMLMVFKKSPWAFPRI